jgi:cytochrome c oxidase subunit 1
MGVSPVLVVFAALYHWFPKITGYEFHEGMGKVHFWGTFLGTYAIYLPMHYLGILGMPRRYYDYLDSSFIPESAYLMNQSITIAALIVGAFQFVFIGNVIYSMIKKKKSDPNPWNATTLEWQTPDNPPVHGNWGPSLPVVHRWAYDYSVPGAEKDFLPQNMPRGTDPNAQEEHT